MAKISGTVTLGGTAVAGARLLLLEDIGTHFIVIGVTVSDALGEYSFIHHKAVDIAKTYHVICQYISGVPEEYRTLSFPYITPVASADANNFTQIQGMDLAMPYEGFNWADLDLDFGLELSGISTGDMP